MRLFFICAAPLQRRSNRSERRQLRVMHRSLTTQARASGKEVGRQLVLLSGGLDSSVLLHHVHARHGSNTLPLVVNYGQRGAKQEAASAAAQQQRLGLDDAVQLDMSSVGHTLRARATERRHVPLLHRNGVLLALAASVAAQEEATGLWIALCKDDESWYASASRGFVQKMDAAIRALDGEMKICTPWIDMGKEGIVHEGVKLKVPFELTWSCMLDYERHCGRCVQCRARKMAMTNAGVVEEEGFYLH